uniref:Uncharacterized protein n=1 Tax=Anguilla anguilla TaxID=7936 RepID=A0A0E9WPM7_ANGAN
MELHEKLKWYRRCMCIMKVLQEWKDTGDKSDPRLGVPCRVVIVRPGTV